MTQAMVGAIWTGICIAAVVALALASRRIGRLRAAAWMMAVAALLLAGEDPWQLVFMASTPVGTQDGVLGLVQPHTLAHMFGGAGMSVAGLVLAVFVAHAALPRREKWAWWALLTVLLVIASADIYELTIYPHGLPLLPTPADGNRGFGWPTLAAGFAVWVFALAFSYRPIFRGSRRPAINRRSGHNVRR